MGIRVISETPISLRFQLLQETRITCSGMRIVPPISHKMSHCCGILCGVLLFKDKFRPKILQVQERYFFEHPINMGRLFL